MIKQCTKCGSENLYLEPRVKGQDVLTANMVALKCKDCGNWLKWCPKDERQFYINKKHCLHKIYISFSIFYIFKFLWKIDTILWLKIFPDYIYELSTHKNNIFSCFFPYLFCQNVTLLVFDFYVCYLRDFFVPNFKCFF